MIGSAPPLFAATANPETTIQQLTRPNMFTNGATNHAGKAIGNAARGTSEPEDAGEPLFLRALARAERDTAKRWAAYRLPVVTPLASFADYAAAAKKRHDLAVERTAHEKELRTAVTAISRGLAARHDDETDRQAHQILAGQAEEAFEGFEELKSQVARLSQRVKSYAQAIRMQEEVISTIRSDRSIDAAEAMVPAHREAVIAIANAVAQLREAFDREEAARMLVTQGGYDARLPSFAAGLAMRPGGQLDEIERRAREYVR